MSRFKNQEKAAAGEENFSIHGNLTKGYFRLINTDTLFFYDLVEYIIGT